MVTDEITCRVENGGHPLKKKTEEKDESDDDYFNHRRDTYIRREQSKVTS
jgi:hypothetical protein